MNNIIKSNKPFMAVIHDMNLDDGAWYRLVVKRIGVKGARLVKVLTTGTNKEPDPSEAGWDTSTHNYIVSRSTIYLVSIDIP